MLGFPCLALLSYLITKSVMQSRLHALACTVRLGLDCITTDFVKIFFAKPSIISNDS
ncbi:hypothetical protein [Sulfurihydrogenibium sp.]|uniref:hypothetical protein n=1 Tax=Sulfurihydrogenibium sp. TaxID=2053621 RepID=UPI0026349084|nr:hypothetical protein [Sulfurihydrogenibium sp.]